MDDPLIDISTGCSAKCRYCLHQYKNIAPSRIMDRAVFYNIIGIIAKEGLKRVYLYMSGEPVLHPLFYDFLHTTTIFKIVPNVASKLPVLFDSRGMEDILFETEVPIEFDITVDSIDRETQKKIAPGLNTEVVLENIKRVAELRKRYSNKFKVNVITVVNRYNEDNLHSLKSYFNNLGLPWAPKSMGFYMGYKVDDGDVKNISDLATRWNMRKRRFKIIGGKIVSNKKKCGSMLKPAISVDGDVSICCHDMLFEINAGNILKEGSLKKIISSDKYQKLYKAGRKMNLHICKGCN